MLGAAAGSLALLTAALLAVPSGPRAAAPPGEPVGGDSRAADAGPMAAVVGSVSFDSGWADDARSTRPTSADEVVAAAPRRGTVRVVVVREADGRPVFEETEVDGRDAARRAARAALADPSVVDVDLGTTLSITASNDTYRRDQWALDVLDAENAWSAQGGRGVTVAVLDTGVDGAHADLSGVVVQGTDFVSSGGNGWADGHGHGTHVAGIVAAVGNNARGVAGLAQGVTVLPVRVLNSSGSGSDTQVARGIVWAADQGADVISMSLGGPGSSTLSSAVSYAVGRGVMVVAAAGNSRSSGSPTSYPAAYPGVLGVAASTSADVTASFSNIGPYVDVTAPGQSILSTVPAGRYASMSGTSMATPYAAAAAALVHAAAPTLPAAKVFAALEDTAKDIEAAGVDTRSGHGRIRPVAAITQVRGTAPTPTPTVTPTVPPTVTPTSSPTPTVSPTPSPTASPTVTPTVSPTVTPTVSPTVSPTPSASPTSPSADPLLPTAVDASDAPAVVAVGTRVTVPFRLHSAGSPLPGRTLRACLVRAPAVEPTCRRGATDATGTVRVTFVATTNARLVVSYAGSATEAASRSREVLVKVRPTLAATAGTGRASVTVTPAADGQKVIVQRRVDGAWVTVRTTVLSAQGRATVTMPSGARVRFVVRATALATKGTSSAVTVR